MPAQLFAGRPDRAARRWGTPTCLAVLVLALWPALAGTGGDRPGTDRPAVPAAAPRPTEPTYRLPLHFEPLTDGGAAAGAFGARRRGIGLRLDGEGAELRVQAADRPLVLRLRLQGARRARPVPREPLPGRVHYLTAPDPTGWRRDVPTFARVAYPEVYPGIDLVFHGREGALEYDFVVKPGGDPRRIAFTVDGGALALDAAGGLAVRAGGAEVRMRPPRVYQARGGDATPVAGRFTLRDGRVGVEVGAFDRTQLLVIDPVLVYSTYHGGPPASPSTPYGGGTDRGAGIAVDAQGNAYVAGSTESPGFPVTAGAVQTALGSGPYGCNFPPSPCADAFVTKLDPTGAVLYTTYLGGTGDDWARGVAVDATGHAYVAGGTRSADFPTTPGALQRTHGGSTCGWTHNAYTCDDAFVAKLAPDGSRLEYATLLGGDTVEHAYGIAVDAAGQAHVVGSVARGSGPGPGTPWPPAFPVVAPFQPAFGGGAGDAFLAKLDAAGSRLVYATWIGGSGTEVALGVAVDGAGNAYVTGWTDSPDFPTRGALQPGLAGATDAFVLKVSPAGELLYATYLGGSAADRGNAIAVDGAHQASVVGYSASGASFPTRSPLSSAPGGNGDAFVAKLDPSGAALAYATLVGGAGVDEAFGVAVGDDGTAYVVGTTASADLPTAAPVQATPGACPAGATCSDAFVLALGEAGLRFGTYLGGSDEDGGAGVAVDAAGDVYVTGFTRSADFPTVHAAQTAVDRGCGAYGCRGDAFVARIDPRAVPPAAPPAAMSAELTGNQAAFRPGETLRLGLTTRNPGAAVAVDAYFLALLPPAVGPALGCPGLDPVAVFGEGFTGLQLTCLGAPPQTFPPLAAGASIPAGTAAAAEFFALSWPPGTPAGSYVFALAFTRPGALRDGLLDAGDVLLLQTYAVTVGP